MTALDAGITQLLRQWRGGNQTAFDQLMPLVYDELHHLAQRAMNQQPGGHTLQTTALVNEAYLRLCNLPQIEWQDRVHFFAVAARIMRFLLVDHARAQGSAKRGSNKTQLSLDEVAVIVPDRVSELLALDEALNRLATLDWQKGQIVEMRYFGGMSMEEIAEILGIAAITVKREWARAKAWLYHELQSETTEAAL